MISSIDNLVASLTSGKFYKSDISKIVNIAAVAGRTLDWSHFQGTPAITTYGDLAINGLFNGSLFNWTANGTGFAVGTNTCVKTSGTGTTLTSNSVNRPLVNGRSYRVSFTVSGFASGTVTVSVGGTSGTARSANNTYVEYITAGATQNIVFTFGAATNVMNIGNVSVVEWGGATSLTSAFAPLTYSNCQGGIYHGQPDVGSDYKHLVNASFMGTAAAAVPAQVYVVDVIGVYPFLDANSLSAQTLTNNLNVLKDFTVATNDILTHSFYELMNLTRIRLTTTGTLPTGLATGTDYFVIKLTDTTCKLASSYANAVDGTAISITSGTGSGTHTINCLLPRYTNGEGVNAYIVSAGTSYSGAQITGTVGAVAHNFLLSYTNHGNTSGKTLPFTVSGTASSPNGHISHAFAGANSYAPYLPLSAGDNGMRSVESFQLSAATGTANTFYHLVLAKTLTQLPLPVVNLSSERDLVSQLPSMPRVYNDAKISCLTYHGAATLINTSYYGSLEFAWG